MKTYIIENQKDLDELKNIKTLDGDLHIESSSIENLSNLESLTHIEGYLYISNNNFLTSLSGLEKLTSIGGKIIILLT